MVVLMAESLAVARAEQTAVQKVEYSVGQMAVKKVVRMAEPLAAAKDWKLVV